jgi:hypothetical protein
MTVGSVHHVRVETSRQELGQPLGDCESGSTPTKSSRQLLRLSRQRPALPSISKRICSANAAMTRPLDTTLLQRAVGLAGEPAASLSSSVY